MRVTLINPPQNTKYPQPPMGLALLASILEREGYDVSVLDVNLNGMNLEELYRIARNSDVVGLTAMTPTINAALDITMMLKMVNPKLKVIMGGAHPTLLPDESLKSVAGVDTVIVGEGDKAILDVLKGDIKGVYWSPEQIDMDSLPYLAYHQFWQTYRPHPPHGIESKWLAMITSRGCPYKCSFCSKGVFGTKYRAQSAKRVLDEVSYYIRKFGIKEIAFYDDVFTLNKGRIYQMCDGINTRGLKFKWTCETRANLVERELLRAMKLAGCTSIAYGIESASQDVLEVIDKDLKLEQIEDAIRLTRESGIQTIGYFMIGSPNETPETIKQTIGFAKKIKLDYAQFSVTTPFPGTKLYEHYKDGQTNWDNYVYAGMGSKTSPVFESDMLSREDIEYWASRAYKEFYYRPSYILQRLQGLKSVNDIKVACKGFAMLKGM